MELSKVNEVILENASKNLVMSLNLNQCKNMESDINSFNIVEFCPSILQNTVDTAKNFAKQNTDILDENLRLKKHCHKSLLCNNHGPWKRKDTGNCFDLTIGNYNSKEICDLLIINFKLIRYGSVSSARIFKIKQDPLPDY